MMTFTSAIELHEELDEV